LKPVLHCRHVLDFDIRVSSFRRQGLTASHRTPGHRLDTIGVTDIYPPRRRREPFYAFLAAASEVHLKKTFNGFAPSLVQTSVAI
jgi:hypothetical protein